MRVLLHELEELWDCRCHDRDWSFAPAFADTEALFVDSIYRNRLGAYTFQCAILESPFKTTGEK